MTHPLLAKVSRAALRKADAFVGRLYSIEKTMAAMALRPYELHLELTNLCNANCVFCPYQFQERPIETMPDNVLRKAVEEYVASGGGAVGLTPIVGDALIDKNFLERVRYLRSFDRIDRIWVTTNAILIDRFGVDAILDSGLTSISISTAGFDEEMYLRVYRNKSYRRMRKNVLDLLTRNSARSQPLPITICLRPDRPLGEVMKDPDFQEILALQPELDFTWSYTNANGRIQREALPEVMRLRSVTVKPETCVQMYNGPIVLANGNVLICSCVASMDAEPHLSIGNILQQDLVSIWTGHQAQRLRASFVDGSLNPTCAGCDMYRDLELYRTREGRSRAQVNLARHSGERVRRTAGRGPFSGG